MKKIISLRGSTWKMFKSEALPLLLAYLGMAIFFFVPFFYFYPKIPASVLWSPTSDPVLNFFIDIILIIYSIALIVSGIVVLIPLLLIYGAGKLLIWLASISPTGAVLSVSIVVGTAILIIRHFLMLTKNPKNNFAKSKTSVHDSAAAPINSDINLNPPTESKANPVFETAKIEKAVLSDDKILRSNSGRKIGSLQDAILSNDQIIRDGSGSKVGRIEQSIWDKDKQIIRGAEGEKEGEIKSDIWGNRIIVDSNGNKVGKIEKNIWGETVIKKN